MDQNHFTTDFLHGAHLTFEGTSHYPNASRDKQSYREHSQA